MVYKKAVDPLGKAVGPLLYRKAVDPLGKAVGPLWRPAGEETDANAFDSQVFSSRSRCAKLRTSMETGTVSK